MIIIRCSTLLVVLLFCLSSVFAQTTLQEVPAALTNQDIVSMTHRGLTPALIIDMIKRSKAAFDMSPAAMADLKRSRVSEKVILPMAERVATENAAQPPNSEQPPDTTADKESGETALEKPSETNCEIFDEGPRKNGVVWCGLESDLPFKVLAERSAPILWFSPNEQLLEKNYNIPQPLPCDEPRQKTSANSSDSPCKRGDYCVGHRDDKTAVVYYQIRRIVRERGSTVKPFDGKVLKLDRIQKLTLRYYFYYCVDCGLGGHRHDLENIELVVLIEKDERRSRYRARVVEVIGAAHGVHWFNNRLRVAGNTVFPITILVEEGKHASAPDNDGGGTFEHKTDINKRVRDAWGLRDTMALREWVPLFPYYLKRHTNQKRPTKPENRIGSKAQIDLHPDVFANYRVMVTDPKTHQMVQLNKPEKLYELRELGSDCTPEEVYQVVGKGGGFDLPGALKRRGAGEDPALAYSSNRLVRAIRSSFLMEEDDNLPENLWEKALQFSYRWDQSHGFALTPPLPTGHLFKGYFVPRAHFTGFSNGSRRYGLDYIYTPSASRWADLYVAGGLEWYREAPGQRFKFGPAWEGGIKFRFPLNFKKKLFVGVRVGVRTSPTKNFSIVAEPGGGLF